MSGADGVLGSISLVFTCVPWSGVRGSETPWGEGEALRELMFHIQQIKSKPPDVKSKQTQGSEG